MEFKTKGNNGEELAVKYLKKKGYKILERNYRSKFGEIDIICYHKGVTVFIEVKTRSNNAYGKGFEAVDRRKQIKIINTAKIYLSQHNGDVCTRFDVVSIDDSEINHIENAFTL